MPESIKDVLLNVLFIFLPIIMYYFLWELRTKTKNGTITNYLFGLVCILSIYLTMSFPIYYQDGFLYDLRYLPLLFALLFAPIHISIFIVLFTILYRYYLGGDGFYFSLLTISLSYLLGFTIRQFFHSLSLRRKIAVTFLATFFVPLMSFFFIATFVKEITNILAMYSYLFIVPITASIMVFIIEKLNDQQLLKLELEKNDQLHLVSEFAASIAHEVRNPMTVSRGFIQLISNNEQISIKERQFLQLALGELDRAQAIITDYLSLAKPKDQRKKYFNVSESIEKVINCVEAYALINNVNVTSSIEPNTYLYGEEGKLIQAMINFVKNGIEAMPDGGEINIALTKFEDYFTIVVKDQGIGLSSDQIEQLGSAFFSTKEKGTGLGLLVSYNIVQTLGGVISVTSKKGSGTEFTLKFSNQKKTSTT
ncbi:sensor histidine kinase [Anaerobacillus alkaliphilus]|nr:HAMP domain-containing sensor histidine kinase [Anaerobacillus alkaliphilus]